jgi:hypothetical protein
MSDPALRINRRCALKIIGAVAATPILLGSYGSTGNSKTQAHTRTRRGIIVVTDDSIPTELMHRQHEEFLSATSATRSLQAGGIGNKANAASVAMTCNAWIAEMRREADVEKVAVLVWTRRFGPMLTVPLKTKADVLVVRTYARFTTQGYAISRTTTVDPVISHIRDLAARMRRNGRPFLVRLEAELNSEPLALEDIPQPGDGISSYANG